MRWIMHVVDRVKDWAAMRTQRRSDEVLRASERTEGEIDRITGEISAGAELLRYELDKLADALQRQAGGRS